MNKSIKQLSEQAIRLYIRKELKKGSSVRRRGMNESTYYTPGSRTAELAQEMNEYEFEGLMEQVKQYAQKNDKSSFDVLDEMMALVEGETKSTAKFNPGDTVKLTWVNENVSRNDVKAVVVKPDQVIVQIIGESGQHKFLRDGKYWFSESDQTDPVVIEGTKFGRRSK